MVALVSVTVNRLVKNQIFLIVIYKATYKGPFLKKQA